MLQVRQRGAQGLQTGSEGTSKKPLRQRHSPGPPAVIAEEGLLLTSDLFLQLRQEYRLPGGSQYKQV